MSVPPARRSCLIPRWLEVERQQTLSQFVCALRAMVWVFGEALEDDLLERLWQGQFGA